MIFWIIIGMSFYNLAKRFNKNKFAYLAIGIGLALIVQLIVGLLYGVISQATEEDLKRDSLMVNIIALIVSGIVTYVVYKYLLKKGEQKENLKGPNYAYPRFGTRCMADTIQLSRNVRAHLKTHPLTIGRLDFLLTASDTAANNTLTKSLAESLSQSNTAPVRVYEFPAKLGIPHDMIDPAQPNANTEISYAKILELLGISHPETRP